MEGVVISFLGSIPVEILNITIVQVALQKGLKSAFCFALACALVELVYSYIAVRMTQAVIDLGGYTFFFEFFSAVLFLGAGVYYIQRKTPQQGEQKLTKSFNQGLMLSIINIVAVPFSFHLKTYS